jgi:hypothetical protein
MNATPLDALFIVGAGDCNFFEEVSGCYCPSRIFLATRLKLRIIKCTFTTLTIIPFALSSMIILIWGNEPVHKRKNTSAAPIQTSFSPENEIKTRFLFIFPSNEMIANQLASHRVTGLKLGVTFTMAGFTWIILSMIIFVMVIFKSF